VQYFAFTSITYSQATADCHESTVERHHGHGGYVTWRDCVSIPWKFLGRFLVRSVLVRGEFELISTVNMDTRHPTDGSFGNELPSIYNRCEVMSG